MSSSIITVENLSKRFIISHEGNERYSTLRDEVTKKTKEFFRQRRKSNAISKEEFWALQNVNFSINEGDRVGIIGRNGAGKSTLLKILSRITEPTKGRITIRGRVASLLEVGTGFHPELTGRENIFLNGAILGMSRIEIREKFDEIVAFAEVEKFLDTPVKRYSSGMYVRLAFAVAAHLEPEILIVDEVLAVGDIQFQKKCLGKMEDVSKNQGRTVIFVSHNIGVISNLCNVGFLMKNGELIFSGNTSDAISSYLSSTKNAIDIYRNVSKNSLSLYKAQLLNTINEPCIEFTHDQSIVVNLEIYLNSVYEFDLGIAVLDFLKNKVFTSIKHIKHSSMQGTFIYVECTIPKEFLVPGNYSLDIALFNSKSIMYEYINDIMPFSIIDNGSEMAIFENVNYGTVFCECKWLIKQ